MTNDLYCSTDGCGDFENNVSKILSDISTLQNKDLDQDARLEALELERIPSGITRDTELAAHTSRTDNPHSVTKAQVGLGSADNTSDVHKPISTATQTALNAKADATALNTHSSNKTNPHGVTKAQVGLGDVNNTSDSAKPISTATQNALDGKQNSFSLYEHTIIVRATPTASFRFSLTVLNQSPTAFDLYTIHDYLGASGDDYKQCSGLGWSGGYSIDLIGVRGGNPNQLFFQGINRGDGDMNVGLALDWGQVEVILVDKVRQIV